MEQIAQTDGTEGVDHGGTEGTEGDTGGQAASGTPGEGDVAALVGEAQTCMRFCADATDEFNRALCKVLAKSTQTLARVAAERDEERAARKKAQGDCADATSTLNMYVNAWWRELGNVGRRKVHQIDALVLTTQDRMAERKAAMAERDALRAEIAAARVQARIAREELSAVLDRVRLAIGTVEAGAAQGVNV